MYVLMMLSLAVASTDGIGSTMLLPLLKASDMAGEDEVQRDLFAQVF